MTAIDLTATYKDRNYRQLKSRPVELQEYIRVIDFAEAAVKKGSALAQNDTIDLFTIPVGTYIYDCFAVIKTASAAAGTVQIGDSGSATGFITSISTNATALTTVPGNGAYIYIMTAATALLYATANVTVASSGANSPRNVSVRIVVTRRKQTPTKARIETSAISRVGK